MGRAGKLNMNIDYVQLSDGEKVPLRAVKGGSGGNHTGAMTGAIVASSILFFPAAPFFLFMHGKDITIPKGTEITAYVAADTPLDPANFNKVSTSESGGAKSEAVATGLSSVIVQSTPAGADITVDDKFLGTTPSDRSTNPGEHKIVIVKRLQAMERTMTISLKRKRQPRREFGEGSISLRARSIERLRTDDRRSDSVAGFVLFPK